MSPSSQKGRGEVRTVMDAVIHECVGGKVYIAIHEGHHFYILMAEYVIACAWYIIALAMCNLLIFAVQVHYFV